MGQNLENGDFVEHDKTSTIVTDTHVILTAVYPNGITRKIKIKNEDLIIALRKLKDLI